MYIQNEQALSRPKNVFDIPALSIIALAATGKTAVRLAYALDAVRVESFESSRGGPGRRRPATSSTERTLMSESWRVK